MAKRISITLSDTQDDYVDQLAKRSGSCPTAYVAMLVLNDIKRGLDMGIIGTTPNTPQQPIVEFVRSLVSPDGVDLRNVSQVCEVLGINYERMSEILGISESQVEVPTLVESGEQGENISG